MKNAIALLITVFFIMAITLSIGLGLRYMKDAFVSMEDESILIQNTALVHDVLKILKKNVLLNSVDSEEGLAVFLSESSFIALEIDGIKIRIEIQSARSKINPNLLKEKRSKQAFEMFLIMNNISLVYLDLLLDSSSGTKEDASYLSDMFIYKEEMFREYISSSEHLQEINEYFTQRYRNNSLASLNMQTLFYVSNDSKYSIDLNYVTPQALEVLLLCDKDRAKYLVDKHSIREELTQNEKKSLASFKTSYFEPYLYIRVHLKQNNHKSMIDFEYNIKSKKGSHFVFKV